MSALSSLWRATLAEPMLASQSPFPTWVLSPEGPVSESTNNDIDLILILNLILNGTALVGGCVACRVVDKICDSRARRRTSTYHWAG